mgnify:CR=1 FL=1
MQHQGRKCHQDRKCNARQNMNVTLTYRKCNIKIEDVIKVESATSMCNIFSAKKNIKGQNTGVMKFNSRQLIHCLKIEILAFEVKMIRTQN